MTSPRAARICMGHSSPASPRLLPWPSRQPLSLLPDLALALPVRRDALLDRAVLLDRDADPDSCSESLEELDVLRAL
ncbi:MAG: hypothetical protein VX259_07105 [Pseudomonadota bacterium]|nr:hypothetical protein [Pseudomonadota bacterium]